jgi:hypothetical protein
MSYEDDVRGPFSGPKTRLTTVGDQRQDLLSAMAHIKHGNTIANEHRKRAASLPFRLANYVTGSTTGVNWIKSMTPVELHAELVYAESLFEKARILNPYPDAAPTNLVRGGSRPCWGSFIPVTGSRSSRKRAHSLSLGFPTFETNEPPFRL